MKCERKSLFRLVALVAVSLVLSGWVWENSGTFNYTWEFLKTWNKTNYDKYGIPGKLSSDPDRYNQPSLLTFLANALPDGKNQSANAGVLFGDGTYNTARNLYVKANTVSSVYVAFVDDNGSNLNSIGYFLFNADDPPTSRTQTSKIYAEKILFPNASLKGSFSPKSAGLKSSEYLTIDLTPAKTAIPNGTIGIGLFLVSDGYDEKNGVRKTGLDSSWIFASLDALNPEANAALKSHAVLLTHTNPNGRVCYTVSFEDLNRNNPNCDHDFNDVTLGLYANPESAVVNTSAPYNQSFLNSTTAPQPPAVIDTDKDGVSDGLDEYPSDPNRASSVWYPTKLTKGLLAFEDAWPALGDFDMNDLVMSHQAQQVLDSSGKIKDIIMTFQIMAKGAADNSGFAVELTGIDAGTPCTTTLTKNAESPQNPTAPTSGFLRYHIFENSNIEAPTPVGAKFVNTVKGEQTLTGSTYVLKVTFTTAVDSNLLKYPAPYNPYLFHSGDATRVSQEVHLPGYQPTADADSSFFKGQDDNTDLVAKRYYVSKAGYPWAINVPGDWKWPLEKIDIVTAYPQLKGWVETPPAGSTNLTWYMFGTVSYVYPR